MWKNKIIFKQIQNEIAYGIIKLLLFFNNKSDIYIYIWSER